MIGSYNCLITANCPITLRLQLCRLIRAKYSSLYTLFEKIVIVMIMINVLLKIKWTRTTCLMIILSVDSQTFQAAHGHPISPFRP